jgi:hypothetical protein
MKIAIATILGLVLCTSVTAQSLKQTAQWLEAFGTTHAYWSNADGKVLHDTIKITGCTVRQTMHNELGKPVTGDDEKASTTMFSLADIDPTSIKAYSGYKGESENFPLVSFETTNAQDKISPSGESTCNYRFDFCVSNWQVNIDTYGNAQRFAKAMKHAVELCGGKPSTF